MISKNNKGGKPGEDTLLAKALNAGELIAYQDGAVVSRTILNQKMGSVTLFAFDTGEGLSEHSTPFDALVYLVDGEAEITISGEEHHVKQGEIIIMPANQPHALKAVEKFKMMLVMIRS